MSRQKNPKKHPGNTPPASSEEKVRIDKWLWAARFFKTRALAAEAVSGGRVHLNDQRIKPSKPVLVGDQLRIHKADMEWDITVDGLSSKRGPASVAVTLYTESEHSIDKRQARIEEKRILRLSSPTPDRRPDKRGRRQIHRFIRKGD